MNIYRDTLIKIRQKTKQVLSCLKRSTKITEQAILCNKLLSKFRRPTSYLEIGVDEGRTFEQIDSEIKHGVDPYGTYDVDYRMTSEMFFALNKLFFHQKYHVILIDGVHIPLIVDKEIDESLKILNKGGYIVLHDTDPPNKETSELVLEDILSYLRNLAYPYHKSHQDSLVWKAYNGDVWKSIAKIRMGNSKIEVFTIENFCCTVLKKGKQKNMMKVISPKRLNWNFFVKRRKEILNLINFNEIEKYM